MFLIQYELKQSYFENETLFSSAQFVFRKHRSKMGAVTSLVADAVEGLENGLSTTVSFCDLTIAFDCVEALLFKLEIDGFRGKTPKLSEFYLTVKQYMDFL